MKTDAFDIEGIDPSALQRAVEAHRAEHALPMPPPASGAPKVPRILSSAEFVNGFVPPDYLLDGIWQKGFAYSFTGQTGAGKTAIALLLSYCIAEGKNFGDREVTKGRVLYRAGENPDDIRMRWLAMANLEHFEMERIAVDFITDATTISQAENAIVDRAQRRSYALVIVDTAAAFFEGSDENDNVAMGAHARRLRSLTKVPGRPTVLVPCHPVKNAAAENLLPRGGGAFLAEVDGNNTATRREQASELHWQGKFRGPDFSPISFHLREVRTPSLVDSKNRQIPTVVAKPITEAERSEIEKAAHRDEDVLLVTMLDHKGASAAALAEAAGWFMGTGAPYKSRVQRLVKQLAKDKLVKAQRGAWTLTPGGEKEAKKIRINLQLVGKVG